MCRSGERDDLMSAQFGDDLRLDQNEQYHWDADPYDQPEAFNPVHTNNKNLVLANALIEVTQRIARNKAVIKDKRKERRKLAAAVEEVERHVLTECPPKGNEVKTLKLQDAYISRKAFFLGVADKLDTAREQLAQLDDEIDDLKTDIDTDFTWVETIKVESENIRTFLAFYKAERIASERGH